MYDILHTIRKIINICSWSGVTVTVTGHINDITATTFTSTGDAMWTFHCDATITTIFQQQKILPNL